MGCKKKCEKMEGCTGFNRGKKGAIESQCWFFSTCTKGTPKGQLANSPMHNVYFVSATAETDLTKTTYAKKNMKVLGLAQHEQEAEADADQDPVVPKCTGKGDCKGEGQDCVGGICVNAATLKYRWTLATVDKKCKGKSIGAIDKGKPEIMGCKKKCERMEGCTGFNRGKKGAIESQCWFFSTCTKDTPKGQLANSPMHNVYFVSATAEVEISKTIVEKKNMKVLGLSQHEDAQEVGEAQHDEEEAPAVSQIEQDPPKCSAKEDCKTREGLDCVGGFCVDPATLKYRWTLATVNAKCRGKTVGSLDKGKPEIMACKKKCEKIPGCTGFNRGKKGAIEAQCWFFDSCTKDTPKGKLANSEMHNVYFVSATADVDIVTKKNMKVLG